MPHIINIAPPQIEGHNIHVIVQGPGAEGDAPTFIQVALDGQTYDLIARDSRHWKVGTQEQVDIINANNQIFDVLNTVVQDTMNQTGFVDDYSFEAALENQQELLGAPVENDNMEF